jgi:hypothetical protein
MSVVQRIQPPFRLLRHHITTTTTTTHPLAGVRSPLTRIPPPQQLRPPHPTPASDGTLTATNPELRLQPA